MEPMERPEQVVLSAEEAKPHPSHPHSPIYPFVGWLLAEDRGVDRDSDHREPLHPRSLAETHLSSLDE